VRRLVVAIIASSCLTVSAHQQPVFRGGTDLVEIDVVVRAADGRFVDDLSPDDFSLIDDSESQTIQQLYLHTPNSARSLSPAPPGRIFVLLFDDAHLSSAAFRRSRTAAESLISRRFRPGDVGAILNAQTSKDARLTSHPKELLDRLRQLRSNSTAASGIVEASRWPRMTESDAIAITANTNTVALEAVVRRACAEDPTQCDAAPDAVRSKAHQLAVESRANAAGTIHLIAQALRGMAGVDGRKAILLMSEGFMAEDNWLMVRDLIGLASQVNARIYWLDARGMDSSSRSSLEPAGPSSGVQSVEPLNVGRNSLDSMAAMTGGFAVRNANQLERAVDRVADDADSYYVLAYRPSTPRDGKFHPVQVTVKRHGVTAHARRGYIAGLVAAVPSAASPEGTPADTAAARSRAEPSKPTETAMEIPTVTDLQLTARSITPPAEATVNLHLRPHATENVRRLAPSTLEDQDAAEGWQAFQRGDLTSAFARLGVAASRREAHVWVYYTLGISAYALTRYRDASDAWERVREAAADFEPVYFDLIDAYLQQRELDRAVQVARAAIDRWPQDAELYQALGVVQTVRGSLDDAVKSFQSALSLAPSDPNTYFNVAKVMELRYFKSRRYVDQLRRWVSNEKDRSAAIENYRRHLELHGMYADAANAGLRRLEWMPTQKQ
jgi:VWFA-related protein